MFDARHGKVRAVGVRITLKIGKSYEERLIEELEKRLEDLSKNKP
jgi:hypothetical protein